MTLLDKLIKLRAVAEDKYNKVDDEVPPYAVWAEIFKLLDTIIKEEQADDVTR